MNLKQVLLFVLVCLVTNFNPLFAQGGEDAKANSPKPEKVKPVKNSNAAVIAQISSMTREEKNTMSNCPLHSKRMSLSDNYRADASDYNPGDEYPFAYQLNYRRYCTSCTRIMDREARTFEAKDRAVNEGRETFERCAIHNSSLKGNPDQDKVDYEKNPAADTPHARQYLFKNYCKICTKIYKIQHPE